MHKSVSSELALLSSCTASSSGPEPANISSLWATAMQVPPMPQRAASSRLRTSRFSTSPRSLRHCSLLRR
eukprot:188791-Hanusia_phi.AAC.1